MGKSPAFQMYVRDWLCSLKVRRMTGEEVKAYMYLLCSAWLETPRASLPDDDKQLASMANVPLDHWRQMKDTILAAFHKRDDGRWYSERLYEVSEQQAYFVECGKKGGNPKFKKGKTNPYYITPHKGNDKGTDNPKITPHKGDDNLSSSTSSSTSLSSSKKHIFDDVVAKYHEILPNLPKCRELTKPKEDFLVRVKDSPERNKIEWWIEYFASIKNMPHLMGKNDRGWTANLGWLLLPSNMTKVLNGSYLITKVKPQVSTCPYPTPAEIRANREKQEQEAIK